MFRMFFIFIVYIAHYPIESIIIEYPSNKYIEERIRIDLDSIDPIFRYYIIPHEIQFHINATKHGLEYFLRCEGSEQSIKFTIPSSAIKHLSLNTNDETHTITAKLTKNKLTKDLVGRYTCSEIINDKIHETTVHVFIQDERSVFTKKLYPTLFKQTGIHFFTLPCQTTNWYPRISCPIPCELPHCTSKERQSNELKCNTPLCDDQDLCIPVYYTPSDLKPEKFFFDPQIGFALENPTIPKALVHFTCMSNYTPNQESKIPFDSSDPDYVQIQQPSLDVMSDEIVKLNCEIQYGTNIERKLPMLFWFEDIYNLNLISNETEKSVFNRQTQLYSRNSSITLRGFKSNRVYRFYCVRVSNQRLYSRSVDITCGNASSLDLEITSIGSDTLDTVSYGSDSIYDITMFTIPRSSIQIEISRNGISLDNDKRFELLLINNKENQFFEYTLTIYDITFEDEVDLKITVKSSILENTTILRPNVTGNPVGQLSFISKQTPLIMPWRNEKYKNKQNIYPYGVFENESYDIVCTIRHRSDIIQPLNIFIQYFQCSIDNCLSNIIDKTCQRSSDQQLLTTKSNQINKFQTEFISLDSHELDSPSIGHQYICCYEEENDLIIIAKAITILSYNRQMFSIHKPEFSLVTGDTLTYRCEGHELIYDDIQMIYNNNLFTYERNLFHNEWRLKDSNQVKQIDIDGYLALSEHIRTIAIEVKTPPLKTVGHYGYVQCIGLSKQLDFIPNLNDTYMINVDDPIRLQFKNNLQSISKVERKAGDNVELDCKYNGQPKPKVIWYRGKQLLNNNDSTLQLGDNNGSISINRAQAADTGYYTCELNNSRDPLLRRSFDLRINGTAINPTFNRLTFSFIIISTLLVLLMFIFLIYFVVKYNQMREIVNKSLINPRQSINPDGQSTRTPLRSNFASTHQIRTLLHYVDHPNSSSTSDNFKELGRGQFGVVYQVFLPEVGLVAAKLLPETIRNIEHSRHKRKNRKDTSETKEMISKHEIDKKKAAEVFIDEIKVMHRAGKHVNIVALIKVAYPETKFKFLFTGGPIRDEDSFYLMELCSNGSLESMLKHFLQSASREKLSLYKTLNEQSTESGMTIVQACERCLLTDDDLKLIAYQVACGVDYLNRKYIVHGDIAPRNVLVNSRFIMKICDFGLAAWTTPKNYREQLENNENVQLDKKSNEIATHNLTPELANGYLHASKPEEWDLVNKLSIKSDVWSFGIFLWSLFIKCRIRPFGRLLDEMEQRSEKESFFHCLACVVRDGLVLRYIDRQPEIPEDVYAIIRKCLVEEDHRSEMNRIRRYLHHPKMLSIQAFEYYRSEYNRYQEDIAADGNAERLSDDQDASDLPSLDDDNRNLVTPPQPDNVVFRALSKQGYYSISNDDQSRSDENSSAQRENLYLTPINDDQEATTDDTPNEIRSLDNVPRTTTELNVPQVQIKIPDTLTPDDRPDSYL